MRLFPKDERIEMGDLQLLSVLLAALMTTPCAESSEIRLNTRLGNVVGTSYEVEFNGETKNVTSFLGIPFAKSPIGDRRFRRPEPYGSFTSTYNATYFRPHCMQSEETNPSVKYFHMSEDCLHLNIFIPGNQMPVVKKYPVMIFIHGGSFTFSGAEVFTGDKLSAFNDVVVVAMSYRLNTFGFLSNGTTSSGNMGLWDQKLAIQWVHDNIADFAGDPQEVTLFGNSAGAACTLYHALNPTNKGLFKRIIAQSGSVLAPWAQQYNSTEMFAEFLSKVNCSLGQYDDVLTCLQSKPAEELVTSSFSPVVDSDFITEDPAITFSEGSVNSSSLLSLLTELDFLSGVQSKDGLFALTLTYDGDLAAGVPRNKFDKYVQDFLLEINGRAVTESLVHSVIHQYTDWTKPDDDKIRRGKMVDFASDLTFFVPAINVIKKHKALAKANKTSYFYVFDHKPSVEPTPLWLQGAKHAIELPYVFGLPDSMKVAAGFPRDMPLILPQLDLNLSTTIMKMWTNFAKTGDPNSPVQLDEDVPQWPQYNLNSQTYIEFTASMTSESVKNHFVANRVEFWTNLVPFLNECDKNFTEIQVLSQAHSLSKSNFIYIIMAAIFHICLNNVVYI